MGQGGIRSAVLFSLELCNDLFDLLLDMGIVGQFIQSAQQVCKRHIWIHGDRLHGVDLAQGFIHTDGVINGEMGFMDFGAKSGCTP